MFSIITAVLFKFFLLTFYLKYLFFLILVLDITDSLFCQLSSANLYCILLCVRITGSPFMLSVGGKPSGRVRETITRQIQAAETVVSGQPSLLQLKLPGARNSVHIEGK